MGTTSNSSFASLLFTLYTFEFIFFFLFSRSFVPPKSRAKEWKEVERLEEKPGVLVGEWRGEGRGVEGTEISAARDNRRRQYFNRRQIYRAPTDHAKRPTRRTCHFTSYPLLLASFFRLTGGVIRRNEPTLRIIRRRDYQSTVEEAWKDRRNTRLWSEGGRIILKKRSL